jgi:maleylpyruvate isomerase
VSTDRPSIWIDLVRTAHGELRQHLGAMGSAGVDPTAPSLLPGWSIGHVLTHIARNADAFGRLLAAADRGDVVEMYVGGAPARNAAIDDGANRPWGELVADVRRSAEALEAQIDGQRTWTGRGIGGSGQTFLAVDVPFLRCREVFVHTADLGDTGYTPARWPSTYVAEDLPRLTTMWNHKHDIDGTPLPPLVAKRPELERVLWLLGRLDVDGVEPAATF